MGKKTLHEIQNYGSKSYSLLPHGVFESPAVVSLSDRAFRVLCVIHSRFRGSNNGSIQIPTRWIGTQISSKNYSSIADAIDELAQHGLLVITFEPRLGQREARKYRLTYASYGTPQSLHPATNEWRSWGDGQTTNKRPRRGKRKHSGLEDASTQRVEACSTEGKRSVEASSTHHDGNEPFFPSPCVEASSKKLISHIQGSVSPVPAIPQIRGKQAGGDFPDSFMDSDELRQRVQLFVSSSGVGAQTRLANEAQIPGGTLSKFLGGRNLCRDHRVRIQSALPRVEAAELDRGSVRQRA